MQSKCCWQHLFWLWHHFACSAVFCSTKKCRNGRNKNRKDDEKNYRCIILNEINLKNSLRSYNNHFHKFIRFFYWRSYCSALTAFLPIKISPPRATLKVFDIFNPKTFGGFQKPWNGNIQNDVLGGKIERAKICFKSSWNLFEKKVGAR